MQFACVALSQLMCLHGNNHIQKGRRPQVMFLFLDKGDNIRSLIVYISSKSIYGENQDLEVFAAPRFNWFYLLL